MLENTVKGKRERVGRMFQMHSNSREQINEGFAGDIVAIVGLKDTTTGDTLCVSSSPVDPRAHGSSPIRLSTLPSSRSPRPTRKRWASRLQRLAAEDPSFRVKSDEESGQTIISGMGELHLDIIVDRMKREFKVEANIGQPQVAYRETITKAVDHDYTHKKQSGGSGQFARIKFTHRAERDRGRLRVRVQDRRRQRAEGIHSGRQKGVESVMNAGPLIGFPMVDVKFTLTDGAYHDVDSSVLAFEIAGRAGFARSHPQGQPEDPRADHEGRGGDAGRIHGRRHRRPEFPPRPDPAAPKAGASPR